MELGKIKKIEILGNLKSALELNRTISPGGHADPAEILIRNIESRIAFFNAVLMRPDIEQRAVNIFANLRERLLDIIAQYNRNSCAELVKPHCTGCGKIINQNPFKEIDDLFFDGIKRRPINLPYPASSGTCK